LSRATTRERIARTALRVLEKEGPDAVSMRRIASMIGITPMAIYHHFPNREALLRSVVDAEFEHFLEIIRSAPAPESPEDQVIHVMDTYLDYALARGHIFDYVFSKPRPDARRWPEDFRQRRSPTLNLVAEQVEKWMQSGTVKQDDVWEVALELWAHAHGYLTLYRAGRLDLSRDDFKKLVQRSIRRLLDGLKT
jgi:AcrR family transcriptional regulator